MKRITVLAILLLIFKTLIAPPSPAITVILIDPIQPYEAIWNATCTVESSNNPFAIGDKHLKHKSYGIAQIRQTRLDDFNKQTGKAYIINDMYDPVKAKEVFMFYATGSIENVARTWNGGPMGMTKKATKKYWLLIQKEL